MCLFFIATLVIASSTRAVPLLEFPDTENEFVTVTENSEPNATSSILTDIDVGEVVPSVSISTIPPPLSTTTGTDIIYHYQHVDLNGDYSFGYATGNGIEVEENGTQKEIIGKDGERNVGTMSSGKYSFLINEGGRVKKVNVVWTADERGFRPTVTISEVSNKRM